MSTQDWITLASGFGGAVLGGLFTLWGAKISFDSQREHEIARENERVRARFLTHLRIIQANVDNVLRHEHLLKLRKLMFENDDLVQNESNRELFNLLLAIPIDNNNQTDSLVCQLRELGHKAAIPK